MSTIKRDAHTKSITKYLLERVHNIDEAIYLYLSHRQEIVNSNLSPQQETNASYSTQQQTDIDRISQYIRFISHDEPLKRTTQNYESRLKIAMFTPLPPLKNGIADYTRDILMELRRFFHIDIFIDDGYTPNDSDIIQNFTIKNHKEFQPVSMDYDLIIYQIGTNPNHAYMIDYIIGYPGLIYLHDYSIAYLYLVLPSALKDRLAEAYPSTDEEFLFSNPLNKCVLDKALGIVVHNNYSRDGLRNQSCLVPIKQINLYAKITPKMQNKAELKKEINLELDELIISSFGFAAKSKHIDRILEVFSELVRKYPNIKLRYIIVGKLIEGADFSVHELLEKYRIEKYVTITGYVDMDTFYKYLQTTDICVNLRGVYQGESSASLARIMACGKPCIVSDIGSFAELPSDVCVKITSDNVKLETELLQQLENLITNEKLRESIGSNAHKYAEENLNIVKIAEEMRDFFVYITNNNSNTRRRLVGNLASFLCNNFYYDVGTAFDYAVNFLDTELLNHE